MFEHEKNMEHPMYKKGFQYVFDHYGVPEKPSEELIRLRKKNKLIMRRLTTIENNNITLKKELDNLSEINFKLNLSRNYYKKTLNRLRIKHKTLTSKWYVKLFVYLESKIRYITN